MNTKAIIALLLLATATVVNCQCNTTATTPYEVTLMGGATTVYTSGTNQIMKLAFQTYAGYTNTTYQFVGASTRCNSGSPSIGTWTQQNMGGASAGNSPTWSNSYIFGGPAGVDYTFPSPVIASSMTVTLTNVNGAISGDWFVLLDSLGNQVLGTSFNPSNLGTISTTRYFSPPISDVKRVLVYSWWNPINLSSYTLQLLKPGCNQTDVFQAELNATLSYCNFNRMEGLKNANTVTYRANVIATTNRAITTSRGLAITQSLQTGMTVDIDFGNSLSVNSSSMQVYGSRITTSAVQSQSFDSTTYTASMVILTSVQFPYQLCSASMVAVVGFNTTASVRTADTNAACSACIGGVTSPCTQAWVVTMKRSTSCLPPPSTMTYSGWNLTFSVGCHSSYTGSCNAPNPGTDYVIFNTVSDNYCPNSIATLGSTATLSSFSDSLRTTANSQFVFGSRSYFKAIVNSDINIQSVRIETVTILAGAPATVGVIYTNPFTNATHYFGSSPTGTYNNQPTGFSGTFAATPTLMAISESVAISGTSKSMAVNFDWVWSGATCSANTDSAVSTTIKVDLRVRFAESVVGDKHQTLSVIFDPKKKKNNMHLLALDANSAVLTIGVVNPDASAADPTGATGGTTATATTEAAASETFSGIVVAGIAGAVVAVLAVVAIAAIAVHQKRAAAMKTATN